MSLLDEILESKNAIKTDSYPMSIGEIVNLYKEGDLVIFPEYQRYFRWSDKQKSEFIESIILDIPIPPIFVSSNADGRWDIIDGLQRTSTILEFMGILKKRENIEDLYEASTLLGTKFLPALNGKKWEDSDPDKSITPEIRRIIKRRSMVINIVDSTVNPNIKYELFQRLNRNGSILKGQEVRNSLMVMINSEFYHYMVKLSSYTNFITIVNITDKKIEEQYDKELIIRFLILLLTDISNVNSQDDMESFLTETTIEIAEHYDSERMKLIEERFIETCDLLFTNFQDSVFRKYDNVENLHKGQFFLGLFEAIFVPVYKNLDYYKQHTDELVNKIQEVSGLREFSDSTKHGVRAIDRMKRVFKLGEEHFNEH